MDFAATTPMQCLRQMLSDPCRPRERTAYTRLQSTWRRRQLRRDDLSPAIVQMLSGGELELDVNRDGCWLSLTPLGYERAGSEAEDHSPCRPSAGPSALFGSRRAKDPAPGWMPVDA